MAYSRHFTSNRLRSSINTTGFIVVSVTDSIRFLMLETVS